MDPKGIKKIDKLIIKCEKEVKNNPTNPRLSYNLGKLYYENEEFSKAIEMFKKTNFLDPNNGSAYFLLGECYYNKTKPDYAKAVEAFENAERLRYYDPELYYYIGEAYERCNKTSKAIENYEDYVRIASKGGYGFNLRVLDRAVSYLKKGNIEPNDVQKLLYIKQVCEDRIFRMPVYPQVLFLYCFTDILEELTSFSSLTIGEYYKRALNTCQGSVKNIESSFKKRWFKRCMNGKIGVYHCARGLIYLKNQDYEKGKEEMFIALDYFKKAEDRHSVEHVSSHMLIYSIDEDLLNLCNSDSLEILINGLSILVQKFAESVDRWMVIQYFNILMWAKSFYIKTLLDILKNKQVNQEEISKFENSLYELHFLKTAQVIEGLKRFRGWWGSLPFEWRQNFHNMPIEKQREGISRLTPFFEWMNGTFTNWYIKKLHHQIIADKEERIKSNAKLEELFQKQTEKFLKAIQSEKEKVKEEKIVVKPLKGKRRYEIYTNGKSFECSEKGLEILRQNKDQKKYDIWYDVERQELSIKLNGKIIQKTLTEPRLRRMLEYFLKNVGYFCNYVMIGYIVWGDASVHSSTIHQMKSRVCRYLTKGILTPFIEPRGEGYYIKRRIDEKELNYCLIIPAD